MNRIARFLLPVALGVAVHGGAGAQTFVEAWGGLAVGNHTATAAGLDLAPRPSFQAVVFREMTRRIGLYGGYAYTAFGCEEGFCLDRDLTVTGHHGVVGVEVGQDGPWLRLGLMMGTVKVGSEGDAPDLGPGAQVSVGLTLGSARLRFLPALSYRWLSASSGAGAGHAVALALELGASYRLDL